ncbi:trafficking protein particle complex subunit 10 [Neolamprologus brichardi]|uniref:trafficking protein particle complex subunit 10 n=1 Tax=Neolamprologus brichardi TaxID=32507 RepID=UPI0016439ECA|nr:trafficking protein particle complex subunit 10 [Neolamprologus brichardi]
MAGQEEKPIIYTMENKPIVTCAGDQALFTSLYTSLAQQLPREPMEWRRTYGRAPKMILLEANFVQFKEELLPKEGNKALLTFPFLHIYWTDCCDTEMYKSSVKEDMMRWQNSLRTHGSSDWVIIVVETNDTKKKNKTNILPRSSIVDKIRSDFCNKQSDRCVVLSDPLKDSSRSQESWNSLLLKLRTLLLMSFTKNLGRFEDEMRTLREKRTQPGWSFCEYFMVQEELAFVFEMLQQFEDALVQYDELDALFTQYVLNFGAGDTANWLGSFCAPVRNWSGLLLRRPIDMEKRDSIQRGEASLLDLRSYLFSRQCTLLIFLQRPWEVTQRALELLHNCVQELRLLEVQVLEGALDCWVFLSCLEVLHRIEGCCDPAQLAANCSHTVGLWAYATDKVPQRKGDPERAETFLQEALKSYVSEGWSLPVTHTRRQVAECQKLLSKTEDYLQTSALLAGDVNLTTDERKHFCQEILSFTGKSGDQSHKVTLSMGVFAQLTQLKFHPAAASVHSGAVLQVELTLRCLMPVSVRIQQLVASIHFEVDHGGTHGRSKGAQRQTHPGTVVFRQSNSSAGPPSSAGAGPSLELDEIQDRSPSDNSLNSTGVICKNTHLLMRRHDSNSPPDTPNCISPPTVGIKEGAQMLKVQDVTLEPGDNSITFTAPIQSSKLHAAIFSVPLSCSELVGESTLSIQSSEKVTSISLPPAPPYHTLEFQLEVLCIIPSGADRPANERLTNGEVRHRPRSYSHPDTPMTAIDQRMSIDCPWSIYSTLLALTFYIPFKTKHSLLSAGNRKYIQVCVQNVSDVNFTLAEVKLTEKQHASLELQDLNTKTQQMCILADSSSNWAVCGKSSGMVLMPITANATHKVQIEVMPLFAGHLPFPKIKVLKYLPHTAAVAIQPDPDSCVENDSLSLLDKTLDDQGDTASIRSRGSVHSVGSGDQQQKGVAMPRLEPFSPGQVFNHSHACQVLVLPATDDHIMEVNAT